MRYHPLFCFVLSDAVLQAIVAAILAIILEWMRRKMNRISETGEKIYLLSNNALGIQLRLNAELSHWKADRTKDPTHIKAAEDADRVLAEYDAGQDKG